MKPSLDLLTREAPLCHHNLVAVQLIQSNTCTFEPEAGWLYFPFYLAKRQSHKSANMDRIQYSTFMAHRKSSIQHSFSSISTLLYKQQKINGILLGMNNCKNQVECKNLIAIENVLQYISRSSGLKISIVQQDHLNFEIKCHSWQRGDIKMVSSIEKKNLVKR